MKNTNLFSFFYSYIYSNRAEVKPNQKWTDPSMREKVINGQLTKIRNEFKPILSNVRKRCEFQDALHELKADKLEQILFDPLKRTPKQYFPSINDIKEKFNELNEEYNIISERYPSIENDFILLFQLCMLIAEFVENEVNDLEGQSYQQAYKLLVLFVLKHGKSNPFQEIEAYLKSLGLDQGENVVHDALGHIVLPKVEKAIDLNGWRNFIKKHNAMGAKYFQHAEKIENTLKRVPESMAEATDALAKLAYTNAVKHPEMARECLKLNLSESFFNRCLDYLPTLAKKKFDTLPDIHIDGATIKHPGYHLVKLPIGDFRALMLGKMTNCCQYIGGDSNLCVIDGITRENNGFYVLLKRKSIPNTHAKIRDDTGNLNYQYYEIIGQGYAWRSMFGNVVFDSWENKHRKDDPIAVGMLTAFGKTVLECKQSTFGVFVGKGGKTPLELSNMHLIPELMLEGTNYGDANRQACIHIDITKRDKFFRDFQEEIIKSTSKDIGEDNEYLFTILNKMGIAQEYHHLNLTEYKNQRIVSHLLNHIMYLPEFSIFSSSLIKYYFKSLRNNNLQDTDNDLPKILLSAFQNESMKEVCKEALSTKNFIGNTKLIKDILSLGGDHTEEIVLYLLEKGAVMDIYSSDVILTVFSYPSLKSIFLKQADGYQMYRIDDESGQVANKLTHPDAVQFWISHHGPLPTDFKLLIEWCNKPEQMDKIIKILIKNSQKYAQPSVQFVLNAIFNSDISIPLPLATALLKQTEVPVDLSSFLYKINQERIQPILAALLESLAKSDKRDSIPSALTCFYLCKDKEIVTMIFDALFNEPDVFQLLTKEDWQAIINNELYSNYFLNVENLKINYKTAKYIVESLRSYTFDPDKSYLNDAALKFIFKFLNNSSEYINPHSLSIARDIAYTDANHEHLHYMLQLINHPNFKFTNSENGNGKLGLISYFCNKAKNIVNLQFIQNLMDKGLSFNAFELSMLIALLKNPDECIQWIMTKSKHKMDIHDVSLLLDMLHYRNNQILSYTTLQTCFETDFVPQDDSFYYADYCKFMHDRKKPSELPLRRFVSAISLNETSTINRYIEIMQDGWWYGFCIALAENNLILAKQLLDRKEIKIDFNRYHTLAWAIDRGDDVILNLLLERIAASSEKLRTEIALPLDQLDVDEQKNVHPLFDLTTRSNNWMDILSYVLNLGKISLAIRIARLPQYQLPEEDSEREKLMDNIKASKCEELIKLFSPKLVHEEKPAPEVSSLSLQRRY